MVNIRLKILEKGKINPKQLIKILQKHEDAIGTGSSTDTSQTSKINALEEAIGSATGDNPSGLAKDVADIQSAIGSATGESPSGLAHDVDDLGDYIAEILTANSLTDPRAETQSETTEPSG